MAKEFIQWNVEPYRYLGELRNRYTTAIMYVCRSKAEQHAKETRQWMRDNASWKDKSGQARRTLQALVLYSPEEAAEYEYGLAYAKGQDTKTLSAINRLRTSDQKDRYEKAVAQGLPPSVVRLGKGTVKMSQVPSNISAVKKFEATFDRGRTPVLTIHIGYGSRVRETYGIYLEFANSGRFAIISKTKDYLGRKFFGELRPLLNLKQYKQYGIPTLPNERAIFEEYVSNYNLDNDRSYRPYSKKVWQDKQRSKRYRTGNSR